MSGEIKTPAGEAGEKVRECTEDSSNTLPQDYTIVKTFLHSGGAVVPVKPGMKEVIAGYGSDNFIESIEALEKVIADYPGCNFQGFSRILQDGLRIVCMDFDIKGNSKGAESYGQIITDNGPLPADLVRVETTSGGWHIIGMAADGWSPGTLAGVDVFNKDSGRFMLPGSRVNGKEYRLTQGSFAEMGRLDEWITKQYQNTPGKESKNRHDTLVAFTMELAATGFEEEEIYNFACEESANMGARVDHAELRNMIQGAIKKLPATRKTLSIKTLTDVQCMEVKPPDWIVPDTIPEGFTLLGAKPKVGKSWLALQLSLAVAEGSKFLGHQPTKTGPVIYLDLEQGDGLLQSRLQRFNQHSSRVYVYNSSDAIMADENHNFRLLEMFIRRHKGTRLVIIDPIKYFLTQSNLNKYQEVSPALQRLNGLREKYQVSFFANHHARKNAGATDDPLDVFNGSIGLQGGADTPMVMTQWHSTTFLYSRGRMAPPFSWAINQDESLRWQYLGPEEEYKVGATQKMIIDTLKEAGGPLSPQEIGSYLNINNGTVSVALSKMVKKGGFPIMNEKRGKWVYVEETTDF